MGMPNELIIVRHGQSEGNVAISAAEAGDSSLYTDAFTTTPGHQWRLTDKGRAQAAAIGAWLSSAVSVRFDRYYVSPFVRTRETAGTMGLPEARWSMNRALRERDWGEIGSRPKEEFETSPQYKNSFWMKQNDPLYWVAPGGESIAQVAEDRVRNVLSTLHREGTGQKVVMVSHGEAMWAFRVVLERLNDEQFVALDADPTEKIHNCEVLHYSRIDPETGKQAPRLSWLRRARPVQVDGSWTVQVGPWQKIEFATHSNSDLLAQVEGVPYLIERPHGAGGTESVPLDA